jgi:CHAT domain-containing protein
MRYRNFDIEQFGYKRRSDGSEQTQIRIQTAPMGQQTIGEAIHSKPAVFGPRLRELIKALNEGTLQGVDDVVELGTEIGNVLLPEGVREPFTKSLAQVRARGDRLRVRIMLDPGEHAALPWEYAYVPGLTTGGPELIEQNFLALNESVSVVRFRQYGGEMPALGSTEGDVRVVPFLASPDGYPPLNLKSEAASLERAFHGLAGFRLERAERSPDGFSTAFNESAHVFHFAGHGEFDDASGSGVIVLEEASSRAAAPMDAQTLSLNLTGKGIRLAIVSACDSGRQRAARPWGGLAGALVGAGIPAVVGLQFPVEDESAVVFNRALYAALGQGLPIDLAMSRARIAVWTAGALDAWGVPVLYLRANEADDVVLFRRTREQQFVATWRELADRAWQHSSQFIAEATGTDQRFGVFRPELYVRRGEMDDALNKLLDGTDPALILTGESGSGKTNVICHWATELHAAGHAVLLYNCGALTSTDLEREIEKDVGAAEDTLLTALGQVDRLARAENRALVIVLDALNDFRGDERQLPLALLKRVNALVGRLANDTRVRLVLTCSSAAWSIMQRRNQPALTTSRYSARGDGEITIPLGRFSPRELEEAYTRYQQVFPKLTSLAQLPASIARQIDTPFLLRILAESSADDRRALATSAVDLGIIEAYYRRRVQRPEDANFLRLLVKRMAARQEALLSFEALAEDGELWAAVREDDPESSWSRLLSDGVLSLREREKGPGEKLVYFTFPMVGSLVLALLTPADAITAASVRELVARSAKFTLAWDAGRMVLERTPRVAMPGLLFEVANSPDPECRELVVAMLIERHRSDPALTKALIRGMLTRDSKDARRTGLKAAYCIGADARDIFVEAAEHGDHALRAAVKDTLYLVWRNEAPTASRATADTLYVIWRRNPGFTLEFMRELVARITPVKAFTVRRRVLALFIELSITIYINHCEKEQVIEQTVELYRELAHRLELPKIKELEERKRRLVDGVRNRAHLRPVSPDDPSRMWPGPLSKILVGILATAFAGPILDAMLPGDLLPADAFFRLDTKRRAPLARIAPYVDPHTDLGDAKTDLITLLDSEHQVFATAGALVLAIHLTHDCVRTAPLARELFNERKPDRRLWVLFSQCVLFSEASLEARSLAEELTRTYLRDHPDAFYGTATTPGSRLLAALDFLFMPLGLATGKRGEELTLFRHLIDQHRARFEPERIARCIRALAPVGFYYPDPVIRLLRESVTSEDFEDQGRRDALFALLGTMRTLHVEQVDAFLYELGLEDARTKVMARADDARLHTYISAFGYFNNAVHLATHYRPMREKLSAGVLTMLSKAESRDQFLVNYARVAGRMFFDADFDLRKWMGNVGEGGRPAPGAPAGR